MKFTYRVDNKPYLEELHIKGFKSFGRSTTVRFPKGITAVVGPNGSGKSNIINAIEFALGSLRFSQLRAKSARDLIYRGQKTTAKEAIVEVVIRGQGPYFEDGKLVVKRRLKHDGSSVYYLNGKRATRLKILDALASINVFPDAHNIVNQGDINRFAEMSPKDRKAMFEKIAGIELYEKKKEKALQELSEVEARIEKVEAVISEKRKRFEKVKDAYDRLQRYLQLKLLQKRADYTLKLRNLEALKEEMERIKETLDSLTQRREVLRKRKEELEKRIEEIEKSLEDLGVSKIVDLEKEVTALQSEIKHLREERLSRIRRLEKLKFRREALLKEKEGILRQVDMLREEEKKIIEKISQLKKEIEEISKKKEEISAEYSKRMDAYKKALQEYEKKRKEWEESELRKRSIKMEIDSLRRRISSIEREIKALEDRKKKEKENIDHLLKRKREAEDKIVKIDEKLKELESKISELEDELIRSSIGYLPREIEDLLASGAKNIPEVFGYSEHTAPFFSIFIGDVDTPKKGWVAVIKEESAKVLLELAKTSISIKGNFSPVSIKPSKDRVEHRRTIEENLKMAREEKRKLEDEKITLMSILKTKIDSSILSDIDEKIKRLKAEIKEKKEKIAQLEKELESVKNVEKPQPPKPVDNTEFIQITTIYEKKMKELRALEEKLSSIRMRIELYNSDIKRNKEALEQIDKEEEINQKAVDELLKKIEELESVLAEKQKALKELQKGTYRFREEKKVVEEDLRHLLKEMENIEINLARMQERLKIIEESYVQLKNEVAKIEGIEPVEEDPQKILDYVERELSKLGAINFNAEKEFEEIKKELEDVTEKLDTLKEEREKILALMEEIEKKKREVFEVVFGEIKKNFEYVFSEVLEGKATLIETEEGIDVDIYIRGKHLSMQTLSGGEKTLTSIAFIFAINSAKPSPFFIFDEVDAALDKANSRKLVKLLRNMSDLSQIIIITHNDIVVSHADQVIGVYIERGVSRVIGLPKERILREAEIWIPKENT